jgi:glutathione peroxidase
MTTTPHLSNLHRWTLLLFVAASILTASVGAAPKHDKELVDLHMIFSTSPPFSPVTPTTGTPVSDADAGGKVAPRGAGLPAATPAALLAMDNGACPQVLRHTFNRLQTGEPQSLCQYRGKVLLVVNTASFCGYTSQYEGLEALYRKYKERGLVVVGFPTNDFGSQEPGTNKEIAEFCRTTYGIQFPMFEKTTVGRLDANPFYATLIEQSGQRPRWNFHKYVIDRSGRSVRSFGSDTTPEQKDLVGLIERLLAEKPGATQG